MELPYKKIVFNETETFETAIEFADLLVKGDVVCLNGNLGSGKSFFVKSICQKLKINTTSSPSFSIVNEYFGTEKVVHIDFYRLKKLEELFDIGFDEYLSNKDAIVFIEWASLYKEILPKIHYTVEINHIEDTSRQIIINKNE